jgi:HlyD family secretion protein
VIFVVGLLAAGGAFTQHALKAAPQVKADEEKLLPPQRAIRKIEDKKATVRTIHPMPGGLENIASMTGHVRAWAQQQVFPAVSGYLKDQVDIGAHVKKGDLLVSIDAPLLRVEVKTAELGVQIAKGQVLQAKARVTTAGAERQAALERIKALEARVKSDQAYLKFRETQLKRFMSLLESKAIDSRIVDEQEDRCQAAREAANSSKAALASADADNIVQASKIESAKAALDSTATNLEMAELVLQKAKIQLGYTHIVAAFDGMVTKRNFDVGEYLDPAGHRPLLTVLRTDRVRVVVDVAESDVSLTHPGVPVDLVAPSLHGVKLAGSQVSRIGFAIDEATNTMRVEIDVPNPKGDLRPGMFMNAMLHLAKGSPNGFTVPASCLVGGKDKPAIYVVCEGQARLTPVRTGRMTGGKVEILSGLRAADRIVFDATKLSGDVVPVQIEKMP